MNYLLVGGFNPEKLDLLLSLTSFRSEDVIEAIKDHLINGRPIEVAAAGQLTDSANLTRALKKLNDVAAKVERCKEIDLYGKTDTAKTVSKVKFDPLQDVPVGINFQAWSSWVLFRKEKRKAVSKRAASMQLKMLSGYDHATQEHIINSSIQNDYQGLFAPKGGSNGQNQPARVSHAQRSADDTEQLLAFARAHGNNDNDVGRSVENIPQPMDGAGGFISGGPRGPEETIEEFRLVAEEDGTFVSRGDNQGFEVL